MRLGQRFLLGVLVFALVFTGMTVGILLSSRGDGGSNGNVAEAQEFSMEPGIRVRGEGQISLVPDTAHVLLGVQVDGEELQALREDADARMESVISGLENDGIPESDIRTATYDISVRRNWESRDQEITGYVLTHMLDVKIADIDQTGTIIDNALDNGANNVGNIRFEVDDRESAIRQAREQAMDDARDKAEHLADLGGVSLGQPIHIDEASPSQPPIPFAAGEMDEAMAADGAAPIQPGESTITVTVNVVYSIE